VTEAALRPLASEADVVVEFRAFELHPAPAPLPVPDGAEHEVALRDLAAAAGVRIGAPSLVPRTRKAHEATRFARERGREDAMRGVLFRAYWSDGADIGRIDVLTALGQEVGLEPEELRIALDIDAFADAVAADRTLAERLEIRHTPTLLLMAGERRERIIGALGPDELRAVVRDLAAEGGRSG
jgi:predicted DsbA family dithiol-disulfide isomerase